MDNNRQELKKKIKHVGSKTANYAVAPKTEDLALVETALLKPKDKELETTEQEINDMVVYTNGITSIDFRMPEKKKEILEKNLNIYENLEETQKILATARRNKKLSEDIKTLELISKSGKLTDRMYDVLLNEDNIKVLEQYMQRKFEEGDMAKAYKEVGTMLKIISDARQEMLKSLNSQKNGKNTRIALKFTNDSGEDFQLGVEI